MSRDHSGRSWREKLAVTSVFTALNAAIGVLLFPSLDNLSNHALSEKMPVAASYSFVNIVPILLGALHTCCAKFDTTRRELNARIAGGIAGAAGLRAVGNASIMLLSDDSQMKNRATQFFADFNEGGVTLVAIGASAAAYRSFGGVFSSFFIALPKEENPELMFDDEGDSAADVVNQGYESTVSRRSQKSQKSQRLERVSQTSGAEEDTPLLTSSTP